MKSAVRTVAATLAVVLFATAAVAAPLNLAPKYKDKYALGVKKQNAGEFTAALELFESIPAESRSYDTRLHIASCRQRLGHLLGAAQELEEIISVAQTDTQLSPGDREAIVDTARSDLEVLQADTPKLSLRVAAGTAGVTVTIDGAVVTPPVERPLDPGSHAVVATRAGAEVFRRDVVLERGARESVEIAAPITPTATTPAPAAPPPEVAPATSPSRTITYVSFGAAAVFAGVSVGAFIARGGAIDDFRASCDRPTDCDPDARDRVRSWEAVAFASAGLAVVGIGIGTFTLFRKSETPVNVAIATGALPGLQLIGKF